MNLKNKTIKEDKMRRRIVISFIFAIFFSIFYFFPTGKALSSEINVNIGIGIGVPPPNVVIKTAPEVFLIPGSYVYFAPEVGVQLFFYSGDWYMLHDGYWFRSSYYKGPWNYLPPSRVPVVFLHLPSRYYEIPRGQKLIPYGQLKKHWKEWEKPRYKEVRDWEKSYHKHWKNQDEGWKKWKTSKPEKGIHKKK
jgi:hypothetical protein